MICKQKDKVLKQSNSFKKRVATVSQIFGGSSDKNIESGSEHCKAEAFDCASLEKIISDSVSHKRASKLKILHVEDDTDLSNIIAMTLNDIAEVTQVNDLINAEKELKESSFDILIFDYKLPDGTCEVIVNKLKNTQNKNAKLLLFSAYEPPQELTELFDKVILKSTVSNEEFINCIKSFM